MRAGPGAGPTKRVAVNIIIPAIGVGACGRAGAGGGAGSGADAGGGAAAAEPAPPPAPSSTPLTLPPKRGVWNRVVAGSCKQKPNV